MTEEASDTTRTDLPVKRETPAPGPGSPAIANTTGSAVPSQADDDGHLIELWLHGKSERTREAYRRDLFQFIDFADLPLQHVRLGDLQAWASRLEDRGLARATRRRKLATVKSLFSFGHRVGYLIYNVGAAITGPKVPDDLAERILTEEQLQRIIALEEDLRNHAILRLTYVSGGRVSEIARLRWRSVQARPGAGQGAEQDAGQSAKQDAGQRDNRDAGQVSLLGKGEKSRSVLLTPATWKVLMALRREEAAAGFGAAEDAVFRSQKTDEPLSRSQLWRIVKKAARRADAPEGVSPHWFRHAHASHALDHGAPAHLVQQTLGHQSLATTSRYAHARPDDSSGQYLGI